MLQRGPLTLLGERLLSFGPPSITALLELLDGVEAYHEFMKLVEEYLPEEVDNMKRLPHSTARVIAFAERFARRYFPLAYYLAEETWGDGIGYEDLLGSPAEEGIPIMRQGLDWDDIHEIDQWGPGVLLIGSVCVPNIPWFDEGVGTVWLEACAAKTQVSPEQLARVPTDSSWGIEELKRYLKGSDYEVIPEFGEYLGLDTGNAFLDTNNERGFADPWDRETVDYLVEDWKEVGLFWSRLNELEEWLAEDPDHYTTMLDFIFQQQEKFEVPANRPLIEVFAEEEANDVAE